MDKKFIGIIVIFSLLFVNFSNAQTLNVTLEKSVYELGDTVLATVKVTNDKAESVTWKVITGFQSKQFAPTLRRKEIELKPNEIQILNYSMGIYEEAYPGKYNFTASLLENSNLLATKTKPFEVEGLKRIDLQIELCEDRTCKEKTDLFSPGESIYVGYTSSIPNLKIRGEVALPTGKVKEIDVPGQLTVNKEGVYRVDLLADKKGYLNKEVRKKFWVSKGGEIPNASVCNGNRKCEPPKENYRTCPQDCPSGSRDNYCDRVKDGKCDPDCGRAEDPDCGINLIRLIVIILGVISLLFLFGFIIYLRVKKR